MTPPSRSELVLVTGASGFLGRAITRQLSTRYAVVGLDNRIPDDPPAGLAASIQVDLTDDESVQAALRRVRDEHDARIASVVHLVGWFDLDNEPDPAYDAITVDGTARLLGALHSAGFEAVEQFVYASTMLVHAPCAPGQRITEDSPLDPRLPYRASKIRAEQVVREQRGDIPAVMLRPAGVYDDRGQAVFLAHQIARIYEKLPLARIYPGDLDTGQPWLHLEDLADAVQAVVERRCELPPELPLLLAEPRTPTQRELQQAIGRSLHGDSWTAHEVPTALARAGARIEAEVLQVEPFIRPWMVDIAGDHYALDLTRAERLLGWRPRHALLDTLPRITSALKADPPGWYRENRLNPSVVDERRPAVLQAGSDGDGAAGDDGHAHESMQQHMQMMRQMHFKMLWVHWLNLMLGAWLFLSPWAFGLYDAQVFGEGVQRVTADRGLADPQQRLDWLAWSEHVSGALIMFFAALSMAPRFAWAQWANAAVGVWLMFAPLVFWSPSEAVYTQDTLFGALVIAFAILVPMMPGMSHESMMDHSDRPPGWSYCPSTYLQRLPIIALGFVGFIISRQLTAYQLGHVDGVWEPFFAGEGALNGTEQIITSSVSKAWPIADAGLGAVSYLFEVLMGVMGDRRRWRTMPWMVAAFGVVVVPLGVVSITFIVIQPIVIGTWCTLCLAAAFAMLVMIPYTLDELVAMGQYLLQSHRRGEPFWRTFFRGGASPATPDDGQMSFDVSPLRAAAEAARGVTLPWSLVACTVLGMSLLFTRILFGTEGAMANSDHLVGSMIITVSVMAMAEVGRPLRWLNLPFGAWLIAAPWLLDGAGAVASGFGIAAGLAVIALSLPRGARSAEHYGSWDRWVL